MGLFGPSPSIGQDEFDWLFACFAWLDRTLGERAKLGGFEPNLVSPRDPDLMSASTASEIFDIVKHRAGLRSWECRLEKGEAPPNRIETGLSTGPYSNTAALGTFAIEGNTPVIHYSHSLLKDPQALVATFAHELSHLVMHTIGLPPGGEALEEHATDCMAVYLGFGVFLANSARQFSQFSDGASYGWSARASGYLSENALVTALALFEMRFDLADEGRSELKDYLQPVHRKARKYLGKRHPDIAADLTNVDLGDWA